MGRFFWVRSCLLIILIKCLKGQKCLWLLFSVKIKRCVSEWSVSDQSVSDKVTYWAVCGQLKIAIIWLSSPIFFTFSVTFLVAMTAFMHKTCTERTKTFLIHRTIDEYTFFAISRHLYRVPGVQKWPIWDQKWPNMAGLPMSRCGPKGSQMVPNGQYNIFLTIWDIFGLIWTLLDHFRQKLIFARNYFDQEALCVFEAKNK